MYVRIVGNATWKRRFRANLTRPLFLIVKGPRTATGAYIIRSIHSEIGESTYTWTFESPTFFDLVEISEQDNLPFDQLLLIRVRVTPPAASSEKRGKDGEFETLTVTVSNEETEEEESDNARVEVEN